MNTLHVPNHRDANAGGYLCTVTNERGETIATQWHDSPDAARKWFAASYGGGSVEFTPPTSKEEADAIEAAGGSPSSLTWPPRPPVMATAPATPDGPPVVPPPGHPDEPGDGESSTGENQPTPPPVDNDTPPQPNMDEPEGPESGVGGVFPESRARKGGSGSGKGKRP